MFMLLLLQDNLLVNLHSNLPHILPNSQIHVLPCVLVVSHLRDQQHQQVNLLDARLIVHPAIQLDNPPPGLPRLDYLLH